MRSDPRLDVIVEHLDPRPSDHVLEVGGGHGVAATLVLHRLTTGTYTGVDRSEAMIAASERRNRDAVAAGRARFVCASFADTDLGNSHFNRLFAARVTAMTRPAELGAAARCLASGGTLLLAFDSPDEARTRSDVESAARRLAASEFASVHRTEFRLVNGLLVCLTALSR